MQVTLVYLQPFRRNSLLKCVSQPETAKKSLKPPVLEIHGYLKSSKWTLLKSWSPVLVMISSMSVPICNHFHARRANSGQITSFYRGCPSFAPSFVRTLLTQWDEILSRNTRDLCYHMVKTRSLCLAWA